MKFMTAWGSSCIINDVDKIGLLYQFVSEETRWYLKNDVNFANTVEASALWCDDAMRMAAQ